MDKNGLNEARTSYVITSVYRQVKSLVNQIPSFLQ